MKRGIFHLAVNFLVFRSFITLALLLTISRTSGRELRTPLDMPTSMHQILRLYLLQ